MSANGCSRDIETRLLCAVFCATVQSDGIFVSDCAGPGMRPRHATVQVSVSVLAYARHLRSESTWRQTRKVRSEKIRKTRGAIPWQAR